uniref:protein spinster homolog 3 n=1 Tax=Jaculus jaculus TaxID=51337 RepID=UPI001E1B4885|nr:protein spinster homolog 3 [Jaculus jaculus]
MTKRSWRAKTPPPSESRWSECKEAISGRYRVFGQQPFFICCLLVSAPVFGYLGDRHSRKAILSLGIFLWSGANLSSSFISCQVPVVPLTHPWVSSPVDNFWNLQWSCAWLSQYSWLFFLSRGVVGSGVASYSTIALTVLSDLFVRDQRSRVVAVFYTCIPVGSGLGYMLGSVVADLTGNWRWALRIMPCLEAVALILLILLVPDPPRGAAEKGEVAVGAHLSSWWEDVRYLGKNWSFVWLTLGITAIAFVTGALGFWAPKFLFEAHVVHGLQLPCFQEPCSSQDSLIFGALTVATGIMGIILGVEAARRYKKVNPRAEPLICASSLLATAPCLYLALILAPTTFLASYVFLALGELFLSCNWAVVVNIQLSVVVPRCQNTAQALQITVGHMLGDAGSPYLTGLIYGTLRSGRPNSYLQHFLSLQQSLLCCAFVIVLGGGCFLLMALHMERDQAWAQSAAGALDSKNMATKDVERQAPLSASASTEELCLSPCPAGIGPYSAHTSDGPTHPGCDSGIPVELHLPLVHSQQGSWQSGPSAGLGIELLAPSREDGARPAPSSRLLPRRPSAWLLRGSH